MKLVILLTGLVAVGLGAERVLGRSAEADAPKRPAAQSLVPAAAAEPEGAGAAEPGASAAPAPVSANLLALRSHLTQIVGRSNTGAQVAVLAVSLDRGDTLFSLNPDVPLAPASNMKIYSTAAALYYLGPEFRFSTYVLGAGDLRDGVLDGDVILYGTGDPSMSGRLLSGSLTPLRALADTLLARGVREVRGDVVGDGSYFDAEWVGRGWNPDNFGAWYSAPVGALSVAENVVSLRVEPGAVGAPGRISSTPQSHGLAVINETITTAGGQTMVRIDHAPEGLVVRGRIARNHPGIARSTPVVDPTNYAAAVFRRVLEEQGVRVHGGVRTIYQAEESPVSFAGEPDRNGDRRQHPRVLAVHLSPTLSDIVAVTNQASHNLFAEALMKTVGRVALGEGSYDAGARAMRYFLECEADMDSVGLALIDGSGLSPLNRVSARKTVELLDVMTRSEHWDAFWASLPEAGRPRPAGLRRLGGTAAAGNLRAKTGTIRTVSSLSGYVRSADGELIAFSIFANNLPASAWLAKRIEDEIGARLAEFSRGEPVAATQPPPPDDPPVDADPPAGTPPTTPPAEAPATAAPQQESARTYQVRAGDTLDAIARRNGTTVAAIERANPGINPRRIQPGQTIRLP